MKQMDWSSFGRSGICYSTSAACYRRFRIVGTTMGYTVSDVVRGDLARTTTLAAAKAWAGIRMGETCVRHEPGAHMRSTEP